MIDEIKILTACEYGIYSPDQDAWEVTPIGLKLLFMIALFFEWMIFNEQGPTKMKHESEEEATRRLNDSEILERNEIESGPSIYIFVNGFINSHMTFLPLMNILMSERFTNILYAMQTSSSKMKR